jgi:HAD superfamily hydrolase (TIGR01549 family)
MMKLAIFDLDDTLINFAATREIAYRRLGEHLDRRGIDAAAFGQVCPAIDRNLFVQFEQGQLSRSEYRIRRFSEPLEAIGIVPENELVVQLNKLFMDCVNDAPMLFDDVLPVLQRLCLLDIRTAILTNGPSDGQRRKLKATGLEDCVDHVAIGEEMGFSKPSPIAFHSIVERFSCVNADALMVGDSPELDYDAARDAGLKALLLDRYERHQGSARVSIRSLEAMLSKGSYWPEASG